jgi:hypothetical protein
MKMPSKRPSEGPGEQRGQRGSARLRRTAISWIAALLVTGAAAAGARAQEAPKTSSPVVAPSSGEADSPTAAEQEAATPSAPVQVLERPWAKGVSPERQQAALKHLQEGNGLLKESLFVSAASKYREALSEWDHPGIHYNLALALLNIDQPVEVYHHLQSATQYGLGPLDAEKLEHAKSYLKLIEKQVASIDLRCDLPGAEVSMDGKRLFEAPGRYQELVRSGTHTITAAKAGYATTVRTETLTYDNRTTLTLKLYTSGELIAYRRRWPLWRPVTVTVLGAAIVATGVVMTLEARNRFQSYDNQVRSLCSIGGCADGGPVSLKNQGNTFERLATISYAAGGAILATGLALLVVDRSIPYRVDPNGERRDMAAGQEASPSLAMAPLLGPGLAGLVGTGRF